MLLTNCIYKFDAHNSSSLEVDSFKEYEPVHKST